MKKTDYRRTQRQGKRQVDGKSQQPGSGRGRSGADGGRGRRQKRPAAGSVDEGGAVTLAATRDEVLAMMHDSLHSFATEMGVLVACQLLEQDVAELCGRRYERGVSRTVYRHGTQGGYVVLAGQKIAIDRPRVRAADDDGGEIELPTYAQLQDDHAMPESVLRRMAGGVSCRNYAGVIDLACEGFGVTKSSVSQQFIRASAARLKQFGERRFDDVRFVAIFIDGLDYAGQMMVCALGVTSDGSKQVLGLRQGATENTTVVKALLSELRDCGVATDQATLFVIDGPKALASAIKQVWGRYAIIQRCQVHKKRNVRAHLPKKHWKAVEQLKATQRWLKRINPDAASSLAEGLEQTVTVVRLKIGATLRATLSTTNPIESAFNTVRQLTGRVKRWRDGDMRLRWCACGLRRAEQAFHRVKGHRDLPKLIKVLTALAGPNQAELDNQRDTA